MAALGRVLGILGWLWFVAGFVAPALDIADIEFFPGLILVFLGRLLRSQAKRQQTEEKPEAEATPRPKRPLNTERTVPEPVTNSPAPPVRTPPILATPPARVPEPPASPAPRPAETATAPHPGPTGPARDVEEERVSGKLFEKLRAGTSQSRREEDVDSVIDDAGADEERRPLSSAEMIARARERWDRR